MKERRNFLIKLVIETKDRGKLIDLSKQQEFEIDFRGSKGMIVNKEKEGTILTFEKDSKKYRVLMKVDYVKKGWFKDEIVGCVFTPLPNENFTIYKPCFFIKSFYGTTERYSYNSVKPTQWRWSGFGLISLFFATVMVLVLILCVKKLNWTHKI